MAKVRRFYHMEYFLLPEDGEPKRVDMLVFPAVVKLFLESGVKVGVRVCAHVCVHVWGVALHVI